MEQENDQRLLLPQIKHFFSSYSWKPYYNNLQHKIHQEIYLQLEAPPPLETLQTLFLTLKSCTSGAKNKIWNVKLTTFELTSRGFSERMVARRRRKSFSVVLALKSPKTWFIRKMLCNCLVLLLLLLFCYTDFLAELKKKVLKGMVKLLWNGCNKSSDSKNTGLAYALTAVVCDGDCASGRCLPVTESCCWVEGGQTMQWGKQRGSWTGGGCEISLEQESLC